MPRTAQADRVELPELLEFVRPRHRAVLITTRGDGRPQSSPLSCGVDAAGRIVISTYPRRAKTANARRDPRVSLCVLSDDWDGPYVHIDGHAEVVDMPDALDGLGGTVSPPRNALEQGGIQPQVQPGRGRCALQHVRGHR